MPRLHLLTVALCAACSLKYDFSETEFRCDQSARCPDPLACIEGVCREPSDAGEPTNPELAKWIATTVLPVGRNYNNQHAAFIGDTLYLVGGYDTVQDIETAVVYMAPAAGGELGAWTTTTPLPEPRALGDVVTVGDRIYVVGGADGGYAKTSVYVGSAGSGGVDSWTATVPLPVPLKAHVAVSANGYIYVMGGGTVNNVRQVGVYFAAVQDDGTLGGWQATASLPAPIANLGGVAAGGFLYAIGGDDTEGTAHDEVYYAALDPNDGHVGPWVPTTSLPAERKFLVAVTDSEYIYVIGGTGGETSVLHARAGADGALGAWQQNEPLLAPHSLHAAVLADGHLFVLGGSLAPTIVEHSAQLSALTSRR